MGKTSERIKGKKRKKWKTCQRISPDPKRKEQIWVYTQLFQYQQTLRISEFKIVIIKQCKKKFKKS